jgi:hypothetical protein
MRKYDNGHTGTVVSEIYIYVLWWCLASKVLAAALLASCAASLLDDSKRNDI